jgi:NTE family protein
MAKSSNNTPGNGPRVALVLAGGIGLGAYEAGAYATLQARMRPEVVAGSSVGAVNAALIAGNPAETRVERLREFWNTDERSLTLARGAASSTARHLQSWASVLQARLFGSLGHFHPRLISPFGGFTSFYDLAPMRARLSRLVDFDRLNGGEMRLAVAMTDIETGDMIVADTGRGDRITMDLLMASCGFLPEFAPVEIGGRLLGDGGLSANAPVEAVLRDGSEDDLICFVVDLFARDGARPTSFERASERKSDLTFGNQTWMRLEALQREHGLCALIDELAGARPASADVARLAAAGRRSVDTLYLSYRAPADEAGPEKPFDLSAVTAAQRWQAGSRDMDQALRIAATAHRTPGMRLHAIRLAPHTDQSRSAAA